MTWKTPSHMMRPQTNPQSLRQRQMNSCSLRKKSVPITIGKAPWEGGHLNASQPEDKDGATDG